jgi:ferritin-like metal-binding protein YciE
MATARETIDTWLRDAHATEAQAATMLRGTAKRNEDYPQFSQRLAAQAERCDTNARAVDACLTVRGSGPSIVKDTVGQVTALGQSLSGTVVGDEVVKAALATTTFARMQAASARALIAAANSEGDSATASTCEALLEASEGFAADIDGMLPELTTEYLARETGSDGRAEGGQAEHIGAGSDGAMLR